MDGLINDVGEGVLSQRVHTSPHHHAHRTCLTTSNINYTSIKLTLKGGEEIHADSLHVWTDK